MNQKSMTASTPESIIKYGASQSEVKNASQRSQKDTNTNSVKNVNNSALNNSWMQSSSEVFLKDAKLKTDQTNIAKLTRKTSVKVSF